MASRTAWAGTVNTGDVVTEGNLDSLPGGMLGFVQATANQGAIGATVVDLTGMSQAVTVGTARRIKISFVQPRINSSVSDDVIRFSIKEGATVLQAVDIRNSGTAAEGGGSFFVIVDPSAGVHTYKVTAERISGSGTFTVVGAATTPMQLIIEDTGPTF